MQNSKTHRRQELAMLMALAIMLTLVGATAFVPTAALIGIVFMNGVCLLIFAWASPPTTVKTGDKNTEDKEGAER